ncbi:MAG: DUF3343 domain-containing protein [Lachnoclostridium edouardi]|uniref:DUF3343 domain-containing protein n=1 Tax=Lachnoclostridium edouardi TaxID=1926283 RepID=UPI0026DBC17A|nr:DUF3343 domain-containing protein [Lachnoclostridium edouardi]MDO4279140.1 DUF3343 domain-containing protein [Lachnoclostridium edouardi]
MRKKEDRMVISFHTTTEAVAMEDSCRRDKIPGRMIPLPTVISAGCGLAWSSEAKNREMILSYMEKSGLEYETAGIYRI